MNTQKISQSHRAHLRTTLVALAAAATLAGCGSPTPQTPSAAAPSESPERVGGDSARCLPDAVDCTDTAPVEECAVGVTECDDVITGDPGAGPADAMVSAFIDVMDSFPESTRSVEVAPASPDGTFPLFIRGAVVNGPQIDLLVSGGEAPCFWIVGAEVLESDDDVIVTVEASGDDSADDCDLQQVSDQSISVELQRPLGDRALLDSTRLIPGGAAD